MDLASDLTGLLNLICFFAAANSNSQYRALSFVFTSSVARTEKRTCIDDAQSHWWTY